MTLKEVHIPFTTRHLKKNITFLPAVTFCAVWSPSSSSTQIYSFNLVFNYVQLQGNMKAYLFLCISNYICARIIVINSRLCVWLLNLVRPPSTHTLYAQLNCFHTGSQCWTLLAVRVKCGYIFFFCRCWRSCRHEADLILATSGLWEALGHIKCFFFSFH